MGAVHSRCLYESDTLSGDDLKIIMKQMKSSYFLYSPYTGNSDDVSDKIFLFTEQTIPTLLPSLYATAIC